MLCCNSHARTSFKFSQGNCKHQERTGAPRWSAFNFRYRAPPPVPSHAHLISVLSPPLPPFPAQPGLSRPGCPRQKERGGRGRAQAQSTERAGAFHSSVLRATWRAGVRKPLGEGVLTASLSISLLRGASAGTMLKKFDKKDEESGEGSLKAWGGQILAQIPGTFLGALFRATVRTSAGAQKGQGLVRRSVAVLGGACCSH